MAKYGMTRRNRAIPEAKALTIKSAEQLEIVQVTDQSINQIRELTKPKLGQPTIYSPDLMNTICERIAAGETLLQVCQDPEMPGRRTIYEWKKLYPEVNQMLDAAYEEWAETMDDANEDILRGGIMSTGDKLRDIELVKHNRWRMSRRNRKKFGEKVDVNHTSDIIINVPYGDDDTKW